MDEKIKEIEDCLSKIVYEKKDYGGKHLFLNNEAWVAYAHLVKNSRPWIEHLLSRIDKLEEGIIQLKREYIAGSYESFMNVAKKLLDEE